MSCVYEWDTRTPVKSQQKCRRRCSVAGKPQVSAMAEARASSPSIRRDSIDPGLDAVDDREDDRRSEEQPQYEGHGRSRECHVGTSIDIR